jgi:hypothetical protein
MNFYAGNFYPRKTRVTRAVSYLRARARARGLKYPYSSGIYSNSVLPMAPLLSRQSWIRPRRPRPPPPPPPERDAEEQHRNRRAIM